MLTKDLLRYHIAGKRIKADLIDVEDPRLLYFAERIISLYGESISLRRKELEELLKVEINSKKDQKLAKGIVKVLDDRSNYSLAGLVPFPELRAKLFSRSASLIRGGLLPENMEELRSNILKEELNNFPRGEIYGDLPENEQLLEVKKTFPKELLERYNMDLVRSLLLYSSRMEITSGMEHVQQLRKVFKYLKFFRLLCRAGSLPGKKKSEQNQFTFVIDGPASILDNSVKYGLLLANFFPVITLLPEWELCTEISFAEGKKYQLKLDHTSKLRCHFENPRSYIPEEIRLFAGYFKERSPLWLLTERGSFHNLPGGENVFADFSFEHRETQCSFDLEIFHLWHKNRIEERLESIEKGILKNYLIAVERSCIRKDPLLAEKLSGNPFVMLFSNFPGVENVCKFLDEASVNVNANANKSGRKKKIRQK